MNSIVSYEIAQALKKCDYDNMTADFYDTEGNLRYDADFPSLQSIRWEESLDAPTIAETVMWIYKNLGVWISVHLALGYRSNKFTWNLIGEHYGSCISDCTYDTPTAAYEAAIKYALTHCVKEG